MILAIDIGNTNIVIGCIEGENVRFVERVSTNLANTELEYVVEFRTLFDLYQIGLEDISGSIISSVVPPLNNIVKSALEKLFHKTPLLVGPGLKTGLNILMDNPGQLGSDLVVNAVAGLQYYHDRYGDGDHHQRSGSEEELYWRHDIAGRQSFSGFAGQQNLPAAKDQSGGTEEGDRQKYHRLHEKRYRDGTGGLPGRYDRAYL